MSRWVEVESLIDQSMSVLCGGGNEEMAVLVEDIEATPSIDLIRCAECKKVREDGGHANCGGYLYCRKWKTLVDEDQFCSWGERSE
jgi:hypothetical protein